MNKVKKKINAVTKKVTTKFKKIIFDIKSNPKKVVSNVANIIIETIKNNILFFAFILLSLFNATLVRFLTINTMENIFNLKPIMADLAVVLALGGISFFLKQKNRFAYLLTINIILTAICMINSLYYTFYTSYVSVSLIATLEYLFQVSDAVTKNVAKVQDFIYILSPIALIFTNIHLKRKDKIKQRVKDKNRRENKKAITCLISSGVLALLFISMLTSLEIGRFTKQWNREYVVMKFGIYTYQLNDIVKSIEPKITSLFGYDNAVKAFNEYFKDRPDEQTIINEYTGIFEGKNIISIHAESMHAVAMGLEFNGKEVTPTLNRLAKESLNFTNFYTQVSVGTSSDSEFTNLTSLMPTNNGTAFVSYFNREYISTPKLLKEKGYYTFSMHANNGSYWNRDVMHKSLGYDHFYSKKEYDIDEVIGLGLSDKSFFRQSVEKIKKINEQGKPYYGTVIMLSNHTPFADVDKYGEFDVDIKEEVYNEETNQTETVSYPYMEGTKLGNYFKSLHYADEALGEFIDALEEEGLLENTVVVIYGDHDARLPKADYVRLFNYDKETDDVISSDDENYRPVDYYQYELLRKVPFMIYSKETKEKLHKDINTVMGMYDVQPTLGNMFGFYNKYHLGKDIFNTTDDNIVVFPNGNWLTNKMYYNTQKSEFIGLTDDVITEKYINDCSVYAEKLLNVSNSLIVYDLIKKQQDIIDSKSDYVEEKVTE